MSIRDNLVSVYMRTSEVYIMVMMLLAAFFACIWIPYNMNEYGIPIFFRDANSNVFLDFLRMRIVAFSLFMTLSGCLPHFNFYKTSSDNTCLHTSSSFASVEWTDSY